MKQDVLLRTMLVEAISVLTSYANDDHIDREVLLAIDDDYCEQDLQRLKRAEKVIEDYRAFKVTRGLPSGYEI